MKASEISALMQNAELDQAMAGMANIAKASMVFFRQLQDEGFSKVEAFRMVMQWQHCMFTASFNQGKDTGGGNQ